MTRRTQHLSTQHGVDVHRRRFLQLAGFAGLAALSPRASRAAAGRNLLWDTYLPPA